MKLNVSSFYQNNYWQFEGNRYFLLFRVMSIMISIGITTTASGLVLYVLLFESIGLPVEDAFLVLPFDAFAYVT